MESFRTAEILAVGSELLTPHRQDTNSLYLTARLNDIGIDVIAKTVVGDDARELASRLRDALDRSRLVITTGGLGPTADDVTREVAAEVLGLALVEDAGVLAMIQRRFESRRMPMPDGNRRQAAVPRGARVLPNPNGTAPGLWIDAGAGVLVLLPGPPRELQPMFEAHVLPHLESRSAGRRVMRRVIRIAGRPESHVEEIAQPIYSGLAGGRTPIQTTILASPGLIELHLSARGSDPSEMARLLESGVDALAKALGPAVVSVDGRSLERVVGDELQARTWTLAVAESCTGGLIGGRITDVPGSSAWFAGGVIAYANDVKVQQLGVPPDVLATHGAVSEPVATAMADGVRRHLGTDVGLAITGIAGPDGGTPEKPVGTVVMAVSAGSTVARAYRLMGDRQTVRQHAVVLALELVRQTLTGAVNGDSRT